MISDISSIIVALSALGAAVFAVLGLNAWRKELTGKAKFDVARNAMLLGRKLQKDFEGVRNPFTKSWESANRPKQQNESETISNVLDEWYARGNRLQPLVENLLRLQEAGWEAEILLDKGTSDQVSDSIAIFRRSYAELSSAIESYFYAGLRSAQRGNHEESDKQWLTYFRNTVYSMENDKFSKQVDEATVKLASALKTYVK